MNMSRPAISSPNEYESSAISILMNMSRPAISSPNEYESSSYL